MGTGQEGLLGAIQSAFRTGQYRFTVHGLREATADEISARNVLDAIISNRAEVVEDYPDDPRGPSCLILGWMSNERPLHIVVSYPPDVAVITTYRPSPERWTNYKKRR